MPNFANITIVGHLGKDPEVKFVGDSAVCKFSIAVNDPFKKDDPATWYNVDVWGKSGEMAGKMLSKGSAVLVNGRPKLRKYQNRDGTDGYSLDVRASEWTFASAKGDSPQREQKQESHDYGPPPMDDDVPF